MSRSATRLKSDDSLLSDFSLRRNVLSSGFNVLCRQERTIATGFTP